MTGDPADADLRSFGRRRGRKPSERQARLLRELLPRVAVEISAPCGSPRCRFGAAGRLDEGESQGANETWFEIGFGGGEHLLWQARQYPSVAIIGCEPFEDGVVKALTAIEAERLSNIRLHMGDAREVLRALPANSIARAFVLFPDPWPKRKHRKRRLVNSATLALLARTMTRGAELRIGTDIGDYARTMLEAFRDEPRFRWQAEGPDDWRIRPSDWPQTRYEAKAEREGRACYYFRFFRA
ncbi:MAG: tRNA (guanine(46)-N(7))-methyltransferase TrmB [Hyphomicrobium sp.]